jgi:hypothetical protein
MGENAFPNVLGGHRRARLREQSLARAQERYKLAWLIVKMKTLTTAGLARQRPGKGAAAAGWRRKPSRFAERAHRSPRRRIALRTDLDAASRRSGVSAMAVWTVAARIPRRRLAG